MFAHPILVPPGSNVDTAAKVFHNSSMSSECQALLTEKNYGTQKSKGKIQARFHDVGRDYGVDEVPGIVADLIAKLGYKVRLGSPEEALLCKKQIKHSLPKWFAVLGKSFDGRWIYWVDNLFLITPKGHGKEWSSCHMIFLVEEL
jgi:hypothetical protein